MNIVQADFRQRRREVKLYFQFVTRAIDGHINVGTPSNGGPSLPPDDLEELLKTLKASCYLLLYNLVESTMRNIVQAIFDEFRAKNIRFDDCRHEIKRRVILNFRRPNLDVDQLMGKLSALAVDIINETFDAKKVFSGNLDADKIRETATTYGFSPIAEKAGWALAIVKERRNELAHGDKSFSDIGKDVTADRLEDARKQTFVILGLTIRSVKAYLGNQHYLSTNAPATCPTISPPSSVPMP